MKKQFFLPILISAVLLTGVSSAYLVNVVSARLPGEEQITPSAVKVSQASKQICEAELLEGLALSMEQERDARAALDRYYGASKVIVDRAESEGRGLSEREDQALEALRTELFIRLSSGLSREQEQRLGYNVSQPFSFLFPGMRLTPEQEQFAHAELYRFHQAEEEIYGRVGGEGRYPSEAEEQALDALEKDLFTHLKQGLGPAQVQNMRYLYYPLYVLFDGVELTSEQTRFVRQEIDRFYETQDNLYERADSLGRDISEAEQEGVYDNFFTRLEQGLSPVQVQQVRAHHAEPTYFERTIVLAGVELTPEQERDVVAVMERYGDPEEFITRLRSELSSEQIDQIRENLSQVDTSFPGNAFSEEGCLWY